MFPDRRVLVKYLNDYTQTLDINVRYDTKVQNISKLGDVNAEKRFTMQDQKGNTFTCKYVHPLSSAFERNSTLSHHFFKAKHSGIFYKD